MKECDQFSYRFKLDHKGHLRVDKRMKKYNARLGMLFDDLEKLSTRDPNILTDLIIPVEIRFKQPKQRELEFLEKYTILFGSTFDCCIVTENWTPLIFFEKVKCFKMDVLKDLVRSTEPQKKVYPEQWFKLVLYKSFNKENPAIVHIRPDLALLAAVSFSDSSSPFRFDSTTVSTLHSDS